MTAVPLKRVVQLPAFCGPATLSMLFSQYDIDIDQELICEYADAVERLADYGTRLDELQLAVRRIAPELSLWAKCDADFDDINILINRYNLAVGVEWQGDSSFADEDAGHYSAIVAADTNKRTILIRDPEYSHKDRKFKYKDFEQRWYDSNEVSADAPAEAKEWIDDYHLLFVLAPKDMTELSDLGLKKVRVSSTVAAAN